MNALVPSLALLRTRRWWILLVVVTGLAMLAAYASFLVSLTELGISPMLLVPGVGTAVLTRIGRSLWPGLVAGDVVGQWVIHQRTLTLVALTVVVHLVICLAGATWMQRTTCWLRDLASTVRFFGISVVLSLIGAILGMGAILMHGRIPVGEAMPILSAWLFLGYLGGFLVAGALIMSWGDPGADLPRELRRPVAIASFILVASLGVLGFALAIGIAVPLSLLGALAIAGRAGSRWGTAAITALAIAAIAGAHRGLAPFGGATEAEHATNTMLAVSLFALAVIMLAGYREAGEGTPRSAGLVALIFAVLMIVTGISSLAANAVAMDRDTPFVLSGLLMLGAGLALGVLRASRAPARRSTGKGFLLAAAAGVVYILNLALYLQAVPLVGSGTATALSMTAPLAVVVLALVVDRTRPTMGVIGAVAIIVTGAAIAVAGAFGSPAGLSLALGSAWIFAASLILTSRALRHAGVIDVALMSALASAAVALPVGLVVEGAGAFALTSTELGELALGALGAQLVPLLGRSWALGQVGPNLVGAEGVLAPVTTAVLSFWLIDATTNGSEVTGLILIAVGALVATLAGSGRARRTGDGAPVPARAGDWGWARAGR